MTVQERLDSWRQEIGQVNMELLELLSRRGTLVAKVRELKERNGLKMFDSEREKAMLDRVVAANPGPFPDPCGIDTHKNLCQ